MKAIIVLFSLIAAILLGSATLHQDEQPNDYVIIQSSIDGMKVSGEGYNSETYTSIIALDGKRVTTMPKAIEAMEVRGYVYVNAYANNMGHFVLMRKE